MLDSLVNVYDGLVDEEIYWMMILFISGLVHDGLVLDGFVIDWLVMDDGFVYDGLMEEEI